MIERRAIDPTPSEVREFVEDALFDADFWKPRQFSRDWEAVLAQGAASAEGGTAMLCFPLDGTVDPAGTELCLLMAWWTDPLRRKHWLIEAHENDDDLPPLAATPPFDSPLCWIAPPGTVGRRAAGGRSDLVVVCRCGVVGTPDSIAWMGDRCGPCHDRAEEGLSPLGAAIHHGWADASFHLLLGGLFLTRVGSWDSAKVGCWTSFDEERPAWEVASAAIAFADNGRHLAEVTRNGVITLRDLGSGRETGRFDARFSSSDPSPALAWVREASGWRLILRAEKLLIGFRVSEEGTVVGTAWRSHDPVGQLRSQPFPENGRFLLLDGSRPRLHDTATGERVVSFSVPSCWNEGDGFILGEEVIGCGGRRFVRWSAADEPKKARGFWGTFDHPPPRDPLDIVEADSRLGSISPAPAGEVASVEEGAIVARCARTFHRRAAFEPARGRISGPLSFSPDGRVLARCETGIVAWPWRELMGVPG